MKQHARMTRIELDPEEGVQAITFHMDTMALDWLSQQVKVPGGVLDRAQSSGSGEVTISWPGLRDVLAAGGKMRAIDDGYAASTEIYDSLCAVFYGYLDSD